MSTIKFRPTFTLPTELKPSEVIERIKQQVTDSPDRMEGQFASEYAMIGITGKQRHFWSPWLHLEVRQETNERMVFGRFSPHPSVWTAFMFSYLSLGCILFFSLIIAWAQHLSEEMPWALLAWPTCLLIGAILWLISQTGQRLASSEMDELKGLVQDSINQ